MEEAAHVECLPDGAELLHERVIETGEVFVLQRAHDRLSKRDGAGLDRIARKLATLDQNFRKDRERVFDELAAWLFEMRLDERVMNFVQRAGELLAVATSPLACGRSVGRSRDA